MAHITSVRIDGLLGRKDTLSFTLERDVNVFFGENGCGKTTLLKIMNAALDRDADAMESLAVDKAEVNIFSINENRVIKHVWQRKNSKSTDARQLTLSRANNELLLGFSAQERLEILGNTVSQNDWKLSPSPANDKRDHSRWAHTFLPTTRLYLGDPIVRSVRQGATQLSETQLDSMFADSINRSWLTYYAQTLQEVRQIQEEGLRAVLHDVLSGGSQSPIDPNTNEKEIYDRVMNFLSRQQGSLKLGTFDSFKKRYQTEENLKRAVDNLDNVEKKIERAMVPIDRFKATVQGLFSGGKTIATSGNQIQVLLNTGQALSIANLSSGEKHLIKILLEAMTAEENSVLIDEPELSMHIDWQRIFIRTVQSLNHKCQLIFASHSPEIMADISDEKIFKL
jgi:energy-coupling factor transporter ATP-binding protein EcfA2